MKRLPLLVLSIIMIISLSACGNSWTTDTFEDLSYSVPSSWTKSTYNTQIRARYFQHVSADGSESGAQLMVIKPTYYENQIELTSVSEIAEKIGGESLSTAGNPSLDYFEPCMINDMPAYEIWVTVAYSNDFKTESRTILIEKPDGIYQVDLNWSSDSSGDFASDYQKIKNSLN